MDVKQIKSKEDVFNLALTSSLNEDMAKIISEIYDELGKEAQISIEETSRNVIEKEIIGKEHSSAVDDILRELKKTDDDINL